MDGNQEVELVAEAFVASADDTPGIGGLDDFERTRAIRALRRWPELKPLLRDVRLRVRHPLPVAFQVVEPGSIDIAQDLFATPALGAFHLRHALEIAVWYRALGHRPDIAARVRCAIAAWHTVFSYHELMIAPDKMAAERNFPDWMNALHQDVRSISTSGRTAKDVVNAIGGRIRELLAFQGVVDEASLATASEMVRDQIDAVAAVLPFSVPCERLLTLGGDTRLDVREDTVLNQYGCSPRPRPWAITFASCTATSISDIAYTEAERLRQFLVAQVAPDEPWKPVATEIERLRSDLRDVLGLAVHPGTEFVLTSSGTDAEYYALHFALGDRARKLVSIVVAPNEVGSGTSSAAAGLHFDEAPPFGDSVQRGSPIEGWSADMVEVALLDSRDASGAALPIEAVDESMRRLVDSNVAAGHRVLIRLVDSSKTGLHMPSFEVVRELRSTHGASVNVMVDAAQMRLGSQALLKYLEAGFMVLITGSKFFTGPPFSGALLVPPHLADGAVALPPFPPGLSHYSSRFDFPLAWAPLTERLSSSPNIGLLSRWRAALWEMRAFHAVPAVNRFNTIRAFGDAVLQRIAENPDFELVAAPGHDRNGRGVPAEWDELPTIFSFLVKKPSRQKGPASPLNFDEAWAAHGWLNRDISGLLPDGASQQDRTLASKRCHIGQPVRVYKDQGVWIAALRIAAGARLVSGVEFDPLLGETQEERLASEVRDGLTVLDKLSLIVWYWDLLDSKKSSG